MRRRPPAARGQMMHMKLRAAVPVLVACALLAGCGEDDRVEAVEAQETNSVTVGEIEYRVTMFRQLNPRIAPDQTLYDQTPPDGEAVMAAFLQVCNHGEAEETPTDDIHLENAFGTKYEPVEAAGADPLHYRAQPVGPDDCRPRDGSVADQALPGAGIVFEVPIADLRERPFVLEISAEGGERRVELDL